MKLQYYILCLLGTDKLLTLYDDTKRMINYRRGPYQIGSLWMDDISGCYTSRYDLARQFHVMVF